MFFTLIHYTTGWRAEPTIELGAVPTVGSLLSLSEHAADDGDDIYYVDNVMYGEGLGATNYLFVRPYNGYGKVAPLTESDRVRGAVNALRDDLQKQAELIEQNAERRIELLRNDLADTATAIAELTSAVENLTDNLMERLKIEE